MYYSIYEMFKHFKNPTPLLLKYTIGILIQHKSQVDNILIILAQKNIP